MISVELSFWVLGILAFLSAWYGIRRYRTPLNPLTLFSVTQNGLFTIFSGIVAIDLSPTYPPDDIVKTLLISSVYLGGATLPYLFHGSLPLRLFGNALSFFGLNSREIAQGFSSMKFALILAGSVVSFVALMFFGGGGTLWLSDTREAYIGFRSGAGPFYALTQWLLTFAMLYLIWSLKPRASKLWLIVLLFFAAMSFLGSKNNMLTLAVIGMAYHNFYIKRIYYKIYIALAFVTPLAFLGLLLAQGSFPSLLEAVIYFRDYFDTTAQMVSRFDEFSFHYGEGWLSSLWFYVPRGIYPDKPYEYGVTLIHQVLFPGAAEAGHTPGLLVWSLSYLDFGILGVFFDGLLGGLFQRMAYEYFLNNKRKFFAFTFALQFAIWPIWTFSPLIIVIILSVSQSIFLRLAWRVNRHGTQRCIPNIQVSSV